MDSHPMPTLQATRNLPHDRQTMDEGLAEMLAQPGSWPMDAQECSDV